MRFNYSYVPVHMRGLFSGCAGLLWAVYLSHSRGARSEEIEPAVEVAEAFRNTEQLAKARLSWTSSSSLYEPATLLWQSVGHVTFRCYALLCWCSRA